MQTKQKKPMTEKQKRRKKRADAFWRAFLFTKDGKPKSSLMIYSFCLSLLFVLMYIFVMVGVVDLLHVPMENVPVILGNLIQSVIVFFIGLACALLLNHFLRDKRIVLATYTWLFIYIVAVFITMAIYMGKQGELALLFEFFVWFLIIPVVPTFFIMYVIYRKNYHIVPDEREEEPEWKKYIHRH